MSRAENWKEQTLVRARKTYNIVEDNHFFPLWPFCLDLLHPLINVLARDF